MNDQPLFLEPPVVDELQPLRDELAQLKADSQSITARSAQRLRLEKRLRDAELLLRAPHLSRRDRQRYATTILGTTADQTLYNRDGTPKRQQQASARTAQEQPGRAQRRGKHR